MNEGSLHQTYVELKGVFQQLADNYDYEIIFIDDGSKDNSYNELLSIKKIDDKIKLIRFSRNFGQVAAINAGFENATGDAVVNISADLQDPAFLILDMVREWEGGKKIIACARGTREDGLISKITSKLFYRIIRTAEPKMPAGGFDYFLLDREVYKYIANSNQHNTFLQGDILWFGFDPHFIEYKRIKRPVGKSRWSLWKKIKYFIDGVVYTSYLPIRLMSSIGVLISFLGLLYALIVFVVWLMNRTPFSGYAPIIMTLLFVSGIIMTMLGIVGEYLWRIYDEVRRRPKYIIKEKLTD